MRKSLPGFFLAVLLVGYSSGAGAVEPGEKLADPVLESRARTISQELRCLVCQNQSIDDSQADLARDLRLLVRERLKKGDSDEQVLDFIVDRYGQFVLLRPRFNAATLVLWLSPALMLLLGAGLLLVFFRRREAPTAAALDAVEKARLDKILNS